MTCFYTSGEAARLQKRQRRALRAACGSLLAALGGCIVLCCLVTTLNAPRRQAEVIALSTLGGWAFILLWTLAYLPARAECRHVERLLAEKAEPLEGLLTLQGSAWRVPGGLVVRQAVLRSGEEHRTLQVLSSRARLLPPADRAVRVWVTQGYITGVEVLP